MSYNLSLLPDCTKGSRGFWAVGLKVWSPACLLLGQDPVGSTHPSTLTPPTEALTSLDPKTKSLGTC